MISGPGFYRKNCVEMLAKTEEPGLRVLIDFYFQHNIFLESDDEENHLAAAFDAQVQRAGF